MPIESLVRAVQNDGDVTRERRDTGDEQTGSALLATIRLLAKLSPDERAAVIELLNALR